MSSPYVSLDNRPLEQWKVIELKEELKKRKLATKGLKEDLLKRLDEAVRIERANATMVEDDDDATQSEQLIEQTKTDSVSCGKDKDPISIGMSDEVDAKPDYDCQQGTLSEVDIIEADVGKGANAAGIEEHPVETTPMIGEMVEPVTTLSGSNLSTDGKDRGEDSTAVLNNDELPPFLEDAKLEMSSPSDQKPQSDKGMDMASTKPDFQGSKTQNESVHLSGEMEIDDSKHLQTDSSFQPLKYQVSEVNPNLVLQVTSDSISTETVSVIEKIELEEDVITDHIKLELDVKHEKDQTPASSDAPHGGEFHPAGTAEPSFKTDNNNPVAKNDVENPAYGKDDKGLDDTKDVEQPVGKKASKEMTSGINADNADGLKNIHIVDLGPEKLSLDQSSGDDAIEEDILYGKQIQYKSDSNKSNDNVEKAEKVITNEDDHVDVVGHDKPVELKVVSTENKTDFGQTYMKRKFDDNEAAGHNDAMKKARRWNTENLKGSEQQSNLAATASPKGLSEPSLKCTGTDPGVYDGTPKERIVPPSSKPPTNSLRIDRFLRPFTLKAVQELLGKTGTVTSFWMDHIKTHCYVSYSSIEEAVETRNAVYNIQWPPNGGRFLVAEFVDPQEVKTRVEALPGSPATTPTGSAAGNISTSKTQSVVPPQPSPRQQVVKQQLPPPPLSSPPVVKERLHPAREPLPREQPVPARERLNLAPPPPPLEKIEPPIVTLDDLFRKTRATPRIYYLPLSDEEVGAKLKSQGKNVNQSAGVACRMFQLRGAAGAVSVMDPCHFMDCTGLRLSFCWVRCMHDLETRLDNSNFPCPGCETPVIKLR